MPKPPASQQHERHRTLLDRIAVRYEQLEARLEELESQMDSAPAAPGPPADAFPIAPPSDAVPRREPSKRKHPRKPR